MKNNILGAIGAALVLAMSFAGAAASPPGQSPKPDKRFESWLKDEVNYLITDAEKKLFLALPTEREKNAFIESFWAKFDPLPMTPVNEFKQEHYKRLEEVRAKYGIHSDRGRILILLGPPNDIESEPSGKYVFPCEIWSYENLKVPSLPSSLRLIFYKPWGFGQPRLYSPLFDGLEYLVPHRHYDYKDTKIEGEIRDTLGPTFLRATKSVSPGFDGLQSETVLRTLRDPQAFRALRAAAGRPEVSTYVSYERIPFELAGFATDDGRGNAFYDVGLTVSPADLTFEKPEAKYYGRQDVYVTIKDAGKNIVASFNDQLSLELSEEEMTAKKAYGLNYAFTELLIPGEYTLNVLLRDFVSNRIGEREVGFTLPAEPRSSPLLLSGRAERLPVAESRASGPATAGKSPFAYGSTKVLPRVNAKFRRDETVILYFEIYPRAGDSGEYRVRYAVRDPKGAEVMSTADAVSLRAGERSLPVQKSFSPKTLREGSYSLIVAISDAVSGSALAEESVKFVISSEPLPAGAFAFEQPYEPSPEEMHTRLGVQCLFRNDTALARQFFTIALSFAPGYLPAKVQLARCHAIEGHQGAALDLLLPLAKEGVENDEVFTILANIYYGRKDLDRALQYLLMAADINVESVEILNFLGGVYLDKGERQKARETFARSLKIRDDQPLVKAALAQLAK
jgi:GWxTD domain-containing protein